MKKITNNVSLALIILLAGCGSSKKEEKETVDPAQVINSATQVIGIGKIEPENGIVELSSNTTGEVAKIAVKEGDTLKKGTLILQLSLKETEIALVEQSAQLSTQNAKNQNDVLALKSAEMKLAELAKQYQTSKNLNAAGAETKLVLEADLNAYQQQKLEVAKAKQQLQVNEQLVNELNQKLKLAKLNTDKQEITAPSDGVVLSLNTKAGQLLSANTVLGEFAALGNNIVNCEVDELYANKVKVGNKVMIYQIAGTTAVAEGVVDYIAPSLQDKSILYENIGEGSDRRVRRIKINILKSQNALLINDKVECKILLD